MTSSPTTPAPETNETPADAQAPAGVRRSRPASKTPRRPETRQRRGPRALGDTQGPDPDSNLANIKLTVGVLAGTHGVHGELKLKIVTDHPDHLVTIREVFLGESEEPTAVRGFRFQGEQGLILLEGIDNPEDGKKLGGLKVRIRGVDAAPLAEGEYFLFQLIGLRVENPAGEHIGTVTDLLETGANDVLVVTTVDGAEMLVPNHPTYVLDIQPDAGRMVIEPPVYLA